MNLSISILEIAVVLIGVMLLLADLWTPPKRKAMLGYLGAIALGLVFVATFFISTKTQTAFVGMFIHDELALFFKQLFLLSAIAVLILSVEFSPRFQSGNSEFFTLILFALSGMMFAASANHFAIVFVALELVAIAFYILTSFLKNQMKSLEAGTKYLILGALSAAFLVYGIALIYGVSGTMAFSEIAAKSESLSKSNLFKLGMLFILVGLGFKIAAFPYQVWVPDVYQGAPTPATAFLAIGSKAAGFVLILRILHAAVPDFALDTAQLFMLIAAMTILYGNLCALAQTNLKRLMGYSSIASAGYLLLGVAAMSSAGTSAILYSLGAYLFAVITAFAIILIIDKNTDTEDIASLAGLSSRAPLLALGMALSMVSLAGIPPLAGFFGKFLLIRSILEQAEQSATYYLLAGVAIVGVAISIYYYFGILRTMYWTKAPAETIPIWTSTSMRWMIILNIIAMLYFGMFPGDFLKIVEHAATTLHSQ